MRKALGRRILLFVIAFIPAAALFRPSRAQIGLASRNRRVGSLHDQLILGLRARTPADAAFVDSVIRSVNQGEIPLRTVNAAYSWARRRRPSYPMPYFQRAMDFLTNSRC